MNKILLALAILGSGTGGLLTARHSTIMLQREASTTRESWIVQTQVLTDAQREQVRLAERIRELKQSISQAEAAGNQKGVWSVLETNRTGDLSPDLREHLLEELGFNWNSSEAFIVVSKETLRYMNLPHSIRQGKLTDSVAAALALTPQERSQVEAAMERVPADFKDWAISHTERSEPRDHVLAQYTLQSYPITNNFMTEVISTIGKQRTELIMGSALNWMSDIGIRDEPETMIVTRSSDGTKQLLKAQVFTSVGTKFKSGDGEPYDISKRAFPRPFLPVFPNGWADVAEREGFELPRETEHK